ncbi:MAG: sugar efflux transporter [Myxococcota bacterium]|nr:sugar efflux transporter [Myxococcota bacterium]
MRSLLDRLRPLYRHASFRRLFVLNALLGLSTSFVLPFMSMFGTLEARMTLFEFGTFMTINAASAIVLASVLAHGSDLYFSRRGMLLLGSLSGAAGYLGYAYFRSFVPLVLVGSVALGVSSITFSQLFAYARELLSRSDVDPAQSAFYINVFRMFIALSWTIGPAIASWIVLRYSYRGLFMAASADLCLFAWVVWRGVPPEAGRSRPPSASASQSLLRLLGRSDLVAHFAAFVLITAAITVSMMNLPLLIVKTLHGTASDVGLAFSVAPVFELPFMLYFGWLASKYSPAKIIRLGMIISMAYYASLAFVGTPWQVDLCQALSAAATAIVSGVAITYFQNHLPNHPATATNLYASAQRIGATAGYFLFVGLASRFGHQAVFSACAGLGTLALAFMLVPVATAQTV